MSLDSFIGMDSGEPMSAASLEKLQERMAQAAAQIAAIQREEKKHKKKEYDLLAILVKFVKTSHKTELTLLISRVLEQNLPANFVLAIILLGNEEIQAQVGDFLMLQKPKEHASSGDTQVDPSGEADTEPSSGEKSLTFFSARDQTLPLKIKIELDHWIKSLLMQAEENPHKLLRTAYKTEYIKIEDEEDYFGEKKYEKKVEIQKPLIMLVAYVVGDFMKQQGLGEDQERLTDFAEFILKGILDKTRETLDKRVFLEGHSEET
ncbi:hypothetical protein HY604_03515 [Candidatus Peregrinibacteria bacterium]|nr:hypothetical protein [Candidatus Peregrinibacteria bacterium]